MDQAKTITDHKVSFIRAQIRQLSAPLAPSPAWRTQAVSTATQNRENAEQEEDDEESSISDKTLEEILNKVNAKIKARNRNVFAVQTQRHVAEQIDTLYWNQVSANDNIRAEADATWVNRNTDLCETDAVLELPERYKDLHFHAGHKSVANNAVAYEEARKNLVALVKERDELRSRAAMYQQLRELLAPFSNARENVQPNLVTKDGGVSQELDRMKMLVARVMGRLGQVQSLLTTETDDTVATSNDDKLAHVLGLG